MSRFHSTLCRLLLTLFAVLFLHLQSSAQSIRIGSLQEEELMLRSLIADSLHFSTVQRPFRYDTYRAAMNRPIADLTSHGDPSALFRFEIDGFFEAGLLPVGFQTTFNSRFPHGENNEAAWYGRGTAREVTFGFFLKNRFFTAEVQPHLFFSENADFLVPRFMLSDPENNIFGTESFTELIDYPYRFGSKPFTVLDPGYSSVRLHSRKLEIGLGTEPQWWGSALRYPLMMSNNAPGFPHLFFGSREGIRIPKTGRMNFRWMLGYPQESGYFNGVGRGERRFFNAVNVSITPAFLQNLTVGLTRTYHIFDTDGFRFDNVTVLFNPFQRVNLVAQQGPDDVRRARNQIASVYFQLRFPSANGEIFGEFFREDHSYDFRDLFMQPHHNSAYSLGLRKFTNLPWFDGMVTHLEFTNLTMSQLQQVRPQADFYTHTPIGQGHTNRGHLLGAAIGPGSNSQYLSFDFHKNRSRIGLFLQRHTVNDNLHFRVSSYTLSPFRRVGDFINHRVNLNAGLRGRYTSGRVSLFGTLVWTKAYNYGRFQTATYPSPGFFQQEMFDRTNMHLQAGITFTP